MERKIFMLLFPLKRFMCFVFAMLKKLSFGKQLDVLTHSFASITVRFCSFRNDEEKCENFTLHSGENFFFVA